MNFYQRMRSWGFSNEKGFEWLLRISVFMTFVGHGAYGFVYKTGWLPFYQVLGLGQGMEQHWLYPMYQFFGIGPDSLQYFFVLTGTMDVTMGILALIIPIRAPFLFLAFWGVFTAVLRPLAIEYNPKGQYSWYEVWERAGNYIPAFVAVYLAGITSKWSIKGLVCGVFERIKIPTFTPKSINVSSWLLRIGTFLLLFGHAGYGAVVVKTSLMKHYASIGLTESVVDPVMLVTYIGYFEFALAFAVLFWPRNMLLWFVILWKVLTEALFITAGAPSTLWGMSLKYYDVFEWIERGGSYLAPLMLIYLNQMKVGMGLSNRK